MKTNIHKQVGKWTQELRLVDYKKKNLSVTKTYIFLNPILEYQPQPDPRVGRTQKFNSTIQLTFPYPQKESGVIFKKSYKGLKDKNVPHYIIKRRHAYPIQYKFKYFTKPSKKFFNHQRSKRDRSFLSLTSMILLI